ALRARGRAHVRAPEHVVVVVPAHDEEQLVPAALDAIAIAAAAVAPRVRTTVVVVANACTDRTAEVARARGATVVEADIADVGAARAAGFAWAMTQGLGPIGRLWLATTDADSRVPPEWLAVQLATAAAGGEVYLGTVALEPVERESFAAWVHSYAEASRGATGHGHVHGASMGMRASVYVAAGGFRSMACGEDVDLVTRAAAAGARIVWDESCPVITSSRLSARAPGGVAADLALSLDADDLPA
ncbi:MAG: glycosyltransferase, partial [Aeromicrobium sp.]